MSEVSEQFSGVLELARVGSLHNALCDPRGRMAHLMGYMRAMQEVGATMGGLPAEMNSEQVVQTLADLIHQALEEGKVELAMLNEEINAVVRELNLVEE